MRGPQQAHNGPSSSRTTHVRIPEGWHSALTEAAREMGMSLADLTRLLYRQFLRGRYTDTERMALEGDDIE